MKSRTFLLLSIVILLSALALTGCWNYREVEKLSVVAGVAIDKGENHKYKITVEIVQISGGKEGKPVSQIITMEGDTIFDAVRNEISLSGKKLYWSHAKVVIISQQIARDGILRVVDWFNRDSETRADVLLLVSKEKKAKDIFKGSGTTEGITSFELDEMMKNEKSLSKAPITELWKFVNELESIGMVATLPTVSLRKNNNKVSPQIEGTAIFKRDQLIGFINSNETKNMLFVLNEVKGGLLIVSGIDGNKRTPVSLEIFKNVTKMKPHIDNHKLEFNIHIDTITALDEVGEMKTIDEKKIKQLEERAGKILKTRVENCIRHIQADYGLDIFGFGEKLREDKPKLWNQVGRRWEEDQFKDIIVHVNTKVHIKGSGMLSKPIQMGD